LGWQRRTLPSGFRYSAMRVVAQPVVRAAIRAIEEAAFNMVWGTFYVVERGGTHG